MLHTHMKAGTPALEERKGTGGSLELAGLLAWPKLVSTGFSKRPSKEEADGAGYLVSFPGLCMYTHEHVHQPHMRVHAYVYTVYT